MRDIIIGAFVMSMCFVGSAFAADKIHSDLWGKEGEKWSPTSRLPDFSFAGYHCGEKPLPTVEVKGNVKDFGAKGDGKTDDTDAFKKAIEATNDGALFIPEGTYILSDILWFTKSNFVLRGEGPEKTILHYTVDLEDVRPNIRATASGRPTSGYSWSGGFLWAKGEVSHQHIATITSQPKRGEFTLELDKAPTIKPGDWVTIEMKDTSHKSLLSHLYSDDPGDLSKMSEPITVTFNSRVSSRAGKTITLERPLRWDIRSEWQPVLKTFSPEVSEVGIEELGMTFPVTPYKGHFTERGKNGIAMEGVVHSWVKNVRISHADSGVFLKDSFFCTIDTLLLDGKRKPKKGDAGHHGITLGSDCLVTNFNIPTKFIHDITFSILQAGNVVKNGKGNKLSFDHHKRAPYENLVSNVSVGDGSQVWRCGGGKDLGKNTGARATFWNVTAKKNMRLPPKKFGPDSINIVGFKTRAKSVTDPKGKWIEPIPPENLEPQDLHAAQLKRRLNDLTGIVQERAPKKK